MYFREAYQAITDFRFYRSVFQQPLLRSLLYLLFLAVISAVIFTLAFSWYSLPSLYRFMDWAAENFPPMEIRDGKLYVEGSQPYVLEYPGDSLYTFVFDTTGEHEPLHKLSEPAVVFGQENLYVMMQGQVHSWPWSQLATTRLGHEEIRELKRMFQWAYYPVAGFAFFLVSFFGKGLQALLLSFFSLSGAGRHGIRLAFSSCVTIAIYSLTPAVAIDLLLVMTGQEVPYFGIIYMLTAAIYSYLAAQKCVVIEI